MKVARAMSVDSDFRYINISDRSNVSIAIKCIYIDRIGGQASEYSAKVSVLRVVADHKFPWLSGDETWVRRVTTGWQG